MNDLLVKAIKDAAPKFNSNVVNGTAKEVLRGLPEFFNGLFSLSCSEISNTIPLEYLGFRRLSPKEEFNRMLTSNNAKKVSTNKTVIDLADGYFYMVEFLFKYNGIEISKPLYLPYASNGNIMKISNTPYVVVPVISDTVITPGYNGVFVRLLIDKFNVNGQLRTFIVNGERVPGQVIYTQIMKGIPPVDKIGKPITPVSLYLLGKYGFKSCMKRYCNIEDYVVTKDNVDDLRDNYNVFESTGLRPSNLITTGYIPHDLKICISKKYELTPFLSNFIYGILYAFDILPNTVNNFLAVLNGREVQGRFYPPSLSDEINEHWRIMLGRLAYRDSFSIMRIAGDTRDHFNALETYLDNFNKQKLKNIGIDLQNFYHMLFFIMNNFDGWLLNSKEYNSDIANRYIDIQYYMANDIIISFNKLCMMLRRRSAKKNVLSEKEVRKIFNDTLRLRAIFDLTSSRDGLNLCISPADYNSDLMYLKCTALLEDQNRGVGVRRGPKSTFPENAKYLRGHHTFVGSLYFLGKSAPSPLFKANPYMKYDVHTGKFDIDTQTENTLNKLDDLLRGKISVDSTQYESMESILNEDIVDTKE